ncbi:siroheme synthase [Vibrio cholerae]
MQYFPLFINLNHQPVLVVGGGEVASRKVDSLVRAGADVTIVSPKIEPYLARLVEQERCRWIQSFYSSELLDQHYVQVWATTDNPELNHQVHFDAKKKRLLVNVVDDQPYCDFITPSIVNRGRIQIAISSGGASPVLVRNIREKLESILPHNLSLQAEFGASKRNDIKQHLASVDERRTFWEAFFANSNVQEMTSFDELETHYQALLSEGITKPASTVWIECGEDVELLSLKALKIMQEAELVLHSENCPFAFVDLVRRDAERTPFESSADLAQYLMSAKQEGLKVVVLVKAGASETKLLQGNDLTIKQATIAKAKR